MGRNVIRALATLDTPHEFEAWIPDRWGWRPDELDGAVTLHAHPTNRWFKMYAENVQTRGAIRSGRVERLLSLGDTGMPSCAVPHLLLVQTPFMAYSRGQRDFPMSRKFRLKIRAKELYFRRCLPTVDLFTVQTRAMQHRLVERWGLEEHRVAVVPSAIEPIDFTPVPSDGAPYLCYLASPSPHKNHACLPAMMEELARRGHDVRCHLTIERTDLPRLVEDAEGRGVADRFEFTGALDVEGAYQLLSNAAVHVMPSKLETFGLPYAEAMAFGCPTVAADRECAREMCGDAALYFPADSGVEAADRVARVLESPEQARKQAEIGRARFAAMQRTWADIAAEYLRLLEEIPPRS